MYICMYEHHIKPIKYCKYVKYISPTSFHTSMPWPTPHFPSPAPHQKQKRVQSLLHHTSNPWTTTTQYDIYIIIEWKQKKNWKKQTNYVFKMSYVQRAAAKISRHRWKTIYRRLWKRMSGVWCNGAFTKGMLQKVGVGAQTSHWLMDSKQNHINIFNEIYIELMYL